MITAALYDNRNALAVPFAMDDDNRQRITDEYDYYSTTERRRRRRHGRDDDRANRCGKPWFDNNKTRRFDHDAMPCLLENLHKMMALRRPWLMLRDRREFWQYHPHRLPTSSSEVIALTALPSYDARESPIHPPTATTAAVPSKSIARQNSSSSSSSFCDPPPPANPSLFRWRPFTQNENNTNHDKSPDHRSMLKGSPMYVQYVDFGEHYDESDDYYYDDYDDEADDSFPLYDDHSSEPDLAAADEGRDDPVAVDVSCESSSSTIITESSSIISSSSRSSPTSPCGGQTKKPRRVSFAEVCVVLEIPHHRLYTPAEREAMWMSTAMIERMAQRNLVEYQYEGGDGTASVLEEDDFVIQSGIAIHPAHMARVVADSEEADATTTTTTVSSKAPATPPSEPEIVLQHLLQELLWGL